MIFKLSSEALEELLNKAMVLKPYINREKLDYARKHVIHHINASQTIYTTRIPLEEEPTQIKYSNYTTGRIYRRISKGSEESS